MPNIIEEIDDALELEVSKNKRVLWEKIKVTIRQAEAEILHLRDGLRIAKNSLCFDCIYQDKQGCRIAKLGVSGAIKKCPKYEAKALGNV